MPYAAPVQRTYFFNEDGTAKVVSEEKQTEDRLAALKAKIAAQEEANTTADPSVPPVGNPYRQEVIDEMELNIKPQGAL